MMRDGACLGATGGLLPMRAAYRLPWLAVSCAGLSEALQCTKIRVTGRFGFANIAASRNEKTVFTTAQTKRPARAGQVTG